MTLLTSVQHWWGDRKNDRSTTSLSDAELMQRYAEDWQPHIIGMLIERHGDALFHFLFTLSDQCLAEDTSQHTWLKVIEKPTSYQSRKALFRTWLFTLGRNSLVDELRKLARWQWQSIDEQALEEYPDYDELLHFDNHESLQQQFDKALEALPFVQKEALMLQLEGFSLEGISDITGEKQETIKSRLRFARKNLKQTMEVSG